MHGVVTVARRPGFEKADVTLLQIDRSDVEDLVPEWRGAGGARCPRFGADATVSR